MPTLTSSFTPTINLYHMTKSGAASSQYPQGRQPTSSSSQWQRPIPPHARSMQPQPTYFRPPPISQQTYQGYPPQSTPYDYRRHSIPTKASSNISPGGTAFPTTQQSARPTQPQNYPSYRHSVGTMPTLQQSTNPFKLEAQSGYQQANRQQANRQQASRQQTNHRQTNHRQTDHTQAFRHQQSRPTYSQVHPRNLQSNSQAPQSHPPQRAAHSGNTHPQAQQIIAEAEARARQIVSEAESRIQSAYSRSVASHTLSQLEGVTPNAQLASRPTPSTGLSFGTNNSMPPPSSTVPPHQQWSVPGSGSHFPMSINDSDSAAMPPPPSTVPLRQQRSTSQLNPAAEPYKWDVIMPFFGPLVFFSSFLPVIIRLLVLGGFFFAV